jgi:hypothetical protein
MHCEWKNYPFAWQGICEGNKGACSVVLEAVAGKDLWIWHWHAFFDIVVSHNNINIL